MDIENIKRDQLVTVEAIRSLSDSDLHIISGISKFQDYKGKNKTHLIGRHIRLKICLESDFRCTHREANDFFHKVVEEHAKSNNKKSPLS